MKIIQYLIGLLFFIAGTNICMATTDDTIVITNKEYKFMIGKHLEIFQPESNITFEEAYVSTKFKKNDYDVINAGFNKNDIWIKFSVSNQSINENVVLTIKAPILDYVTLYIPYFDGIYDAYSMKKSGNNIALKNRENKESPDIVFNLDLLPEQTKTYYLKISSQEQIILPIYLNSINELNKQQKQDALFIGLFIGVMSIMTIYNLFLFFAIKSKSYLYYVIYVICFTITQLGMEGYTDFYLWPNSTFLTNYITNLFACFSAIAALIFASDFLRLRLLSPNLLIYIRILILVFSVAILLIIFNVNNYGFILMQICTFISSFLLLIIAIYSYKKGNPMAIYFLFGWSLFLCGVIIYLLKDFNVIPYNNFIRYAVKFGACLEVALLSLGLAHRINVLKSERDKSKLIALNIAKKNEEIIKRQNQLLEEKVAERTNELQEINISLERSITDLKQTQKKLIASEKMASLGQLIAGIAHEINNPVNFISSNLMPIQRDIFDFYKIIKGAETIIYESQNEQMIADFKFIKDKFEFEYIKEELLVLVRGLKEGSDRTTEIVKGLLSFAREDAKELRYFNVNNLINSTLILLKSNTKEINIVKNYENIPELLCYPGKLSQVFLNILTNAVHAIYQKLNDPTIEKENNFAGQIDITTYLLNETICIEFTDNGCGIPEDVQKKMFDPFFTTKDVGVGTGLGMFVVFNIVQSHNGDIIVDSIPNVGTTIVIKIPLNSAIINNDTL